ncbi:hypothetical protein KFE25_000954 [Diacronema lutheri]|uniref:Uncharacterized protein n=2 Tax=Diacronema lutheri TaxID=2081491 RepID=A0A8J5XA54_DIALT|nr:hypothetical protein KFE25_000954 [Diacronema lutheri]
MEEVEVDEPDVGRSNPRMIEWNRRVKPVPKLGVKNAVLLLLLLGGLSGTFAGLHRRSAALALCSIAFTLGWCCCPWCALERELRSGGESAPLIFGRAGPADEERQSLTADSGA